MTLLSPVHQTAARGEQGITGPQLALAGGAAAAFILTATFRDAMPHAAVLPALSTLLLVLAGLIAAVTWRRPTRHRFGYLDAAGVLAFVGLCVAALIEPQQMPALLAGAEQR